MNKKQPFGVLNYDAAEDMRRQGKIDMKANDYAIKKFMRQLEKKQKKNAKKQKRTEVKKKIESFFNYFLHKFKIFHEFIAPKITRDELQAWKKFHCDTMALRMEREGFEKENRENMMNIGKVFVSKDKDDNVHLTPIVKNPEFKLDKED